MAICPLGPSVRPQVVKTSENAKAAQAAEKKQSDFMRLRTYVRITTVFDGNGRNVDFLARRGERTVVGPYLQSTVRCKVAWQPVGSFSLAGTGLSCLPVLGTVKLPPGCCCCPPAGH